jgi:hypothetical protein
MAIFIDGRIIDLVVIAASFLTFYLMIRKASGDEELYIRKLPGLEAMGELVGRAVETDRPVFFCSGTTGTLSSSVATQLLAGVSAVSYLSQLTAENGARLIVAESHPDLLPMVDAVVKTSYESQGLQVPTDTVQYLPTGTTFTLAAGAIIKRERPAASVLIGPFSHASVFLAQAASEVGAIQVAGTARTLQIPFFAAICDYCLIAEDIYVIDAYVSRRPSSVGSIVGEDPLKLAAGVLCVIVAILATLNIPWLTNLLSM